MKIVSYNIQFGRGMDMQIDLVRICDAIRDADIICLQEVDQWWRRSGDCDQAAAIENLLPRHYAIYGASFNTDASYRNAEGDIVNRRRRQGNMILSRWPLLSMRSFNLPKIAHPRLFNMQMLFIEAVIDTGPVALRVYNYHGGYLGGAERIAQVDYFAEVFKCSPLQGGAWSGKASIDGDDWSNGDAPPPLPPGAIVCGDFNASPDTEEYARLLDDTGLIDCWSVADPQNLHSSSLRKQPSEDISISGKVDHILVSADMVDKIETVAINQLAVGSDHKPVELVLNLSK